MIHLFNKTEYSPFLQLSELNTQLSQTNQLKYAASAQPTQKSTAFTQLIRRSEKKPQHFYSFNAGLKKTQLLRSFFKKAAEKPAFTQLLRRAAFNFGKGCFLDFQNFSGEDPRTPPSRLEKCVIYFSIQHCSTQAFSFSEAFN